MHRTALAFLALALALAFLAPCPAPAQYVSDPDPQLRTLFDVTRFLNKGAFQGGLTQVIHVCTSGRTVGGSELGSHCDYSNVREAVEAANALVAAQVAGVSSQDADVLVLVHPTKPISFPSVVTHKEGHYVLDQPFTMSEGVTLKCSQGAASNFNDGGQTNLIFFLENGDGTPFITMNSAAIEGCKIKNQGMTYTAATPVISASGNSMILNSTIQSIHVASGSFASPLVEVTGGFLYVYGSILSAADDYIFRITGSGSLSVGWSFLRGGNSATVNAVRNEGTGFANMYFVRLGDGMDDTSISGPAWNNVGAGSINVIHSPHPSAGTAGVDWWDRADSHMVMTVADSGDGNPAALSIDPLSRVCLITCADADGCAITVLETSSKPAQDLTIINAGASNDLTIAESAGVVALTASSVTLTPDDAISLRYSSAKWVQAGTVQAN